MSFPRSLASLVAPALLLAGCSAPVPPVPDAPADLVVEGTIWTGDPGRPWARWVSIRGERIEAVGETGPAPAAVTRLDVGERLVVPGFNDSHLHLAAGGARLLGAELEDAPVPAPGKARRLAETRRALDACRRRGITSVQDVSPLDQVDLYDELRRAGELTVRVHFGPSSLDDVKTMLDRGWIIGAGDEHLRFGTVKTDIDGTLDDRTARFFEPYADDDPDGPKWRGSWGPYAEDLADLERRLLYADSAKIQLRVHAVGDRANSVALDLLETLESKNGKRDRRFRLARAEVLARKDLDRLRRHDLVAEVQPYGCADDLRWMEERIGAKRRRGACAFRSLQEAGAVLAFGSGWPGTDASPEPIDPLHGLYAAVTRRTPEGAPPGGGLPDERLPLEDALRAYTRGGAYATFEDDLKGGIEPGKLADLAVLDTNLFETPPSEWLAARVDVTILGGRVIYDRAADTASGHQ